jgi:hypothetical protein
MCGLPRYLTTANVKDIVDAFLPFCAQSQPTRYPSISSALRFAGSGSHARFSSSHHIGDCRSPTVTPSAVPTMTPTLVPTLEPSTTPTETPTKPKSTASPSNTPTELPTTTPTASPSQARAGLDVA